MQALAKKFIIIGILLFSNFVLRAQFGNIEFVENKGQWDSRVAFRSNIPAGAFFIRTKGFTVLQHDEKSLQNFQAIAHNHSGKTAESNNKLILRSHAYSVDFVNGSETVEIIPDKPLDTYNNYFIGSDSSKWANHCRIFQAVTLKNIYPKIDVRYYTENGRMKYDIVAWPGADLNKIVLQYTGADNIKLDNRDLIIKTSVGDVKELDPFTYQFENNQRKQISCKYILRDNELRFSVKNYDNKAVLIIDPTLIFSSFSGSTGSNWGFTATYGADGSFFGAGINIESGFPTSTGAFQTVWGGGTGNTASDISIIRLSPNGANRIYSTYIGGSGNDQPHSLVADAVGNIIIAGRTNSPNYPVTGSGQIGSGGGYDIVITKLNAAGTGLIGSKKIGGSGDDGVNIEPDRNGVNSLQQNYGDDGRSEVILDGAGNIYLASCTQSTNFPTTGGSFQTSSGGVQDGVVLKMDPNVTARIFASYLGGSGNDAAYVLSLAPSGNIFVAGGTASADFPGNHTNTIGTSFQGGLADGFISEISNNGATHIRSTYIGTNSTDQIFGIQFDQAGQLYTVGQTRGTWPIINATYNNGTAPQFIAKLQPNLSSYIYSTTFGRPAGTPNISITAFLVDNCENVYVSGWGGDINPTGASPNPYQSSLTTGMPVTPDAIQNTTDGNDFYFFVLKKDAASQLFGSFFGQVGGSFPDHVDGGTSRFDKQGVIYQAVCGNCGGGVIFPTTPGVWSPTNGAGAMGGCNLAMIKISFDFAGVEAGIQSSIGGVSNDTSGCVPLTVNFIDSIANALTYYWNFGDGTPQVITTVPNVSHTYNSTGLYLVMLIAEDPTTCNIRDTSYINIRVGDLEALIDFNPVKLLPCDSLKYRFDNLSVAPPLLPFGAQTFKWNFGDGSPMLVTGTVSVFHSYVAPGSYVVTLYLQDTGYCNSPDSISKTINIAPLVVAQFTTPALGCAPYNARFTNTSIAGQSFFWNFGDGNTSTATNPTHAYLFPGFYTVTLIATDNNTCNISDTTFFSITVNSRPISIFNFTPNPSAENTPTTFNNLASIDAISFKWLFGDGDSVLTNSRLPIIHQYNATGIFNACLISINAFGCADTTCLPIQTLIVPSVAVPSAFTPNSGDVNSKVLVRGFGIASIKFIIWNRWGQKIFESNDRNIGWDGKYKGILQPIDVYMFTLEVVFFDGTKTTKTGDITLLR